MSSLPHPEAFVRWFRQVAPYVHDFGGRTFVIAFGGEMVAERARFASFVHDINLLAALEIRLVLVHGARPQVVNIPPLVLLFAPRASTDNLCLASICARTQRDATRMSFLLQPLHLPASRAA